MKFYLQFANLAVSLATLWFLIKYVGYTKEIAEQSVIQSEAVFKPAIIAFHSGGMEKAPMIRNIGKGPALEVRWTVLNTDYSGKFDFIEPDINRNTEAYRLGLPGIKALYESAASSNVGKISFTYRSISGRRYSSVVSYDIDRSSFDTEFLEEC